jgi:tetratricopeptide (TPR) repeat protein
MRLTELKQRLQPQSFRFRHPRALWNEAERARATADRTKEDSIYRHLVARKQGGPDDYLYAARAHARLDDPTTAFQVLEAGIQSFPVAEDLLGEYARRCAETGNIDRLISMKRGNGDDELHVYEQLFESIRDASVQVSLITHCLSRGYSEFAAGTVQSLPCDTVDTLSLWRLADLLLQYSRTDEARSIYEYLATRPPRDALSLVHSALALDRLRSPERALDMLEDGYAKYTDSDIVFERYVHVASELDQAGRVIASLVLGGADASSASMLLFDRFDDASVQLALINYCFKVGDTELAESRLRKLRERQRTNWETWRLAEFYTGRLRPNDARESYQALSSGPSDDPQDYLISALSLQRLERLDKCLETLEAGLTAFPRADELLRLYVRTCARHLKYQRYVEFVATLDGAPGRPLSKFEFYREASQMAALDFVVICGDLERELDPEAFRRLIDEFIEAIPRTSDPFLTARHFVFFSRYLAVRSEISNRIYAGVAQLFTSREERRTLRILNELTPPMIPDGSRDLDVIISTISAACRDIVLDPVELSEPIGEMTPNWTPWQPVFCLARFALYSDTISALERVAFQAWPKLNYRASHVDVRIDTIRPLRIGFMVHDSMPMMSGLAAHLDRATFETVFLRPGLPGQSRAAQSWMERTDRTVEYSSADMYDAIETIAAQELDIIVSGPSVAAVFFPMMARLASLQMVLLEPNWTDGLTNADYYISWEKAEPHNAAELYATSVALLDHPPYWVEQPALQIAGPVAAGARASLFERLLGRSSIPRMYLCANTLPKVHPDMDDIFDDILSRDPEGLLVFLRSEYPPARVLRARLRERLGKRYDRVEFLPTLSRDDAHLLLQAADCCLDSYPLCGMSSSFDAGMLGVPLVTLPAEIPFGKWTAAIYDYIGVQGLTATSPGEYVEIALRLASDKGWRLQLAEAIRSGSKRYVESQASADEFEDFLLRAWERRLAGHAPADWIAGKWQ